MVRLLMMKFMAIAAIAFLSLPCVSSACVECSWQRRGAAGGEGVGGGGGRWRGRWRGRGREQDMLRQRQGIEGTHALLVALRGGGGVVSDPSAVFDGQSQEGEGGGRARISGEEEDEEEEEKEEDRRLVELMVRELDRMGYKSSAAAVEQEAGVKVLEEEKGAVAGNNMKIREAVVEGDWSTAEQLVIASHGQGSKAWFCIVRAWQAELLQGGMQSEIDILISDRERLLSDSQMTTLLQDLVSSSSSSSTDGGITPRDQVADAVIRLCAGPRPEGLGLRELLRRLAPTPMEHDLALGLVVGGRVGGGDGKVLSLASSPCGRYVAVGMNDEIVKIFPTGALWAKKGISGSGSDQRRGGAGFVRGADAIPSLEDASPEYLGGGREGGSGGGDQDEDEDDGESRKNFDSSRVETGLLGGDVRDGDGVVTIECGEGFDAWSMTFSDDSSMLLGGGGADGGVRVWDARSGKQIQLLGGHAGGGHVRGISSVEWIRGTSKVATGGGDDCIMVWDTAAMGTPGESPPPKPCTTLSTRGRPVHDITCTRDGSIVAALGGQTVAWYSIADIEQGGGGCGGEEGGGGEAVGGLDGEGRQFLFPYKEVTSPLPGAEAIVSVHAEHGKGGGLVLGCIMQGGYEIAFHDVNEAKTYRGAKGGRCVPRCCLVGGKEGLLVGGGEDGGVCVWGRSSGVLVKTLLTRSRAPVGSLCIIGNKDINGSHGVATGDSDGAVHVWGFT